MEHKFYLVVDVNFKKLLDSLEKQTLDKEMATAESLRRCPSKLGTALFLTATTVATPTTSFILLNNFVKAKRGLDHKIYSGMSQNLWSKLHKREVQKNFHNESGI